MIGCLSTDFVLRCILCICMWVGTSLYTSPIWLNYFIHAWAITSNRAITLGNMGKISRTYHDNKVHGANMGPIWGRQDPGGPHVDPTNFAIWVPSQIKIYVKSQQIVYIL